MSTTSSSGTMAPEPSAAQALDDKEGIAPVDGAIRSRRCSEVNAGYLSVGGSPTFRRGAKTCGALRVRPPEIRRGETRSASAEPVRPVRSRRRRQSVLRAVGFGGRALRFGLAASLHWMRTPPCRRADLEPLARGSRRRLGVPLGECGGSASPSGFHGSGSSAIHLTAVRCRPRSSRRRGCARDDTRSAQPASASRSEDAAAHDDARLPDVPREALRVRSCSFPGSPCDEPPTRNFATFLSVGSAAGNEATGHAAARRRARRRCSG